MDRSLVMADIPGLIEGAHAGAGLGHEFLRHVERTRVLIHLVEPEPMDGTDPIENYRAIRSELEQYGHGLAERPEIVAVSKAELPGAAEVQQKLAAESGRDVLLFSSVTGQGLDKLLQEAHTVLDSKLRPRSVDLASPHRDDARRWTCLVIGLLIVEFPHETNGIRRHHASMRFGIKPRKAARDLRRQLRRPPRRFVGHEQNSITQRKLHRVTRIHKFAISANRRLMDGNLLRSRRTNLQRHAIARSRHTRMAAIQIDKRHCNRGLHSRARNWPKSLGRQRQECARVRRMLSMRANRSPRALRDQSRFDGINRFRARRVTRHHQQRALLQQHPIVKIAAERPPMRAPAGNFKFLQERSKPRQLCVLTCCRGNLFPSA